MLRAILTKLVLYLHRKMPGCLCPVCAQAKMKNVKFECAVCGSSETRFIDGLANPPQAYCAAHGQEIFTARGRQCTA